RGIRARLLHALGPHGALPGPRGPGSLLSGVAGRRRRAARPARAQPAGVRGLSRVRAPRRAPRRPVGDGANRGSALPAAVGNLVAALEVRVRAAMADTATT